MGVLGLARALGLLRAAGHVELLPTDEALEPCLKLIRVASPSAQPAGSRLAVLLVLFDCLKPPLRVHRRNAPPISNVRVSVLSPPCSLYLTIPDGDLRVVPARRVPQRDHLLDLPVDLGDGLAVTVLDRSARNTWWFGNWYTDAQYIHAKAGRSRVSTSSLPLGHPRR